MQRTRPTASVFILCAGSGERWNDHFGVPKQLIPFAGTPLLMRTLRQLESRTDVARVHCVTRDPRIVAERHTTLRIAPTRSLVETLAATLPHWSARNVFLLGDVFYSERALWRMFDSTRDLVFFGRPWPSAYVRCGHGELFGMSFVAATADRVLSLTDRVMAARGEGISGNLWNLYQAAAGLRFGSSRRDRRLLVTIDDYTNDIDTPADYARRGALYECIARGRDRGVSSLLRRAAAAPRHFLWLARWLIAPDRRRPSPYVRHDVR